jgi:isoquinoline 1-oxidoreductase subunit beta
MDQAPAIEVYLIPSTETPGGIGETGTTAGPPAVHNAIFAATGYRCAGCRLIAMCLQARKML